MNEIDETQYSADFRICEGYISFSSELLRLSLLAMGGFGTLVLIKFDKDTPPEFLDKPILFLLSMTFFTLCAGAALFHRFYASEAMSWYIAWLRAKKSNNPQKAAKESTGFIKFLKYSSVSLIVSEWLFGAGVLFFLAAILALL